MPVVKMTWSFALGKGLTFVVGFGLNKLKGEGSTPRLQVLPQKPTSPSSVWIFPSVSDDDVITETDVCGLCGCWRHQIWGGWEGVGCAISGPLSEGSHVSFSHDPRASPVSHVLPAVRTPCQPSRWGGWWLQGLVGLQLWTVGQVWKCSLYKLKPQKLWLTFRLFSPCTCCIKIISYRLFLGIITVFLITN